MTNVTVNPPNCIEHLTMIRETCPRCGGEGKITILMFGCACPGCGGDGYVTRWVTTEQYNEIMKEG